VNLAVSRTQLLRGKFSRDRQAIRPPWSLPENHFVDHCTRFMECARACPENLITVGSGGFPEVSFADAVCTFCDACADVCPTGAILGRDDPKRAERAPWRLELKIAASCISANNVVCMVCKEYCDAGAIRFPTLHATGKPMVDDELCTGCGACIAPCPVDAISLTPEQGI